MPIENLIWCLPRPRRKDKYPGGFPLHFEKKLLELYNWPEKILHPFGGMAEYGDRVDLNPTVNPTWVGDAHNMDWILDDSYNIIILDPPYDDKHSKELYGTGKICYKDYIREAVRVCKPEGFIVVYHWVMTPRPPGTSYHRRIVILTRIWHRPRVCCIFQKESYGEQ